MDVDYLHNLATFLSSLTDEDRLFAFQILDSLAWYYIRHRTIPDPLGFQFPAQYVSVALQLAGYFGQLSHIAASDALHHVETLRPVGVTLNILFPADVQLLLVRPVCGSGLHALNEFQDQTFRDLVTGPTHANEILTEFHSLNDDHAKDMILTKVKSELADPDNAADEESEIDEDISDILTNTDKGKTYVRQLFEAMVDRDGIIDKKQGKHRADPTALVRVLHAPNALLEALCWTVLEATVAAHRGEIHISPWGGLTARKLYETYPTFDARFTEVVNALKCSKALVNNLMANAALRHLAAHPQSVVTGKEANNKVNSTRGQQIKDGIKYDLKKKERSAASTSRAGSSSSAGTLDFEDAQ